MERKLLDLRVTNAFTAYILDDEGHDGLRHDYVVKKKQEPKSTST